jgi:hypothetical protein
VYDTRAYIKEFGVSEYFTPRAWNIQSIVVNSQMKFGCIFGKDNGKMQQENPAGQSGSLNWL